MQAASTPDGSKRMYFLDSSNKYVEFVTRNGSFITFKGQVYKNITVQTASSKAKQTNFTTEKKCSHTVKIQ